jgi:hypothetical protein
MDSIPLYSYIANFSPNPIGITLYDNDNQEIGQFLGTDIIDGYVYVHDGTELHTKEMTECFVLEGA